MSGRTAIVPVKPLALAKSRLRLPPSRRAAIARALTEDTFAVLASAASIERVVVVTADAMVAAMARRRDWRVVVDRPLLTPDGLNCAVRAGARVAGVVAREAPVLVLPVDLASLTPADLDGVVARMGPDPAYVVDHTGRGTTIVGAPDPRALVVRLGPGSAARHRAAGLRALTAVPEAVRCDVDRVADLAHAVSRGVGPALTRELGLVGRRIEP